MANLTPATRKDPFQALRNEIEHAFDRWLPARQGNGHDLFAQEWPFGGATPTLDMDEDENEIRVRAELPGVEKDDFKVEVVGNRLTIRGEKKTSKEEKKKDYFYTECSYGSFARTVTLPCEVNADKVDAKLKNGVLDLRLPKVESSKAKRVQVKVS